MADAHGTTQSAVKSNGKVGGRGEALTAEVVGELDEAGVDRSDGSMVRSWRASTEKTTMAPATKCLGLRRRPGPIKSSAVELLDALPHAGDAGGRDNDDGAAITVGSHEIDSVQRGRGTMGIEGGNDQDGGGLGLFC